MDRAERRRRNRAVAKRRRPFAKDIPTMSDNELAVRHPYDCGRRCFLCHMDKLLFSTARRLRERRQWKRDEDRAW